MLRFWRYAQPSLDQVHHQHPWNEGKAGSRGYQPFASQVRAHPKFKSVPILMLTTEGGDDAKAKGRAAGVTGWITKPFIPEKLLAGVAKVCG